MVRRPEIYQRDRENPVKVFIHSDDGRAVLGDEAARMVKVWHDNLSYVAGRGRWDFSIHVWDKDRVVFIEAGTLFGRDERLGLLSASTIVMVAEKGSKTFPLVICEKEGGYAQAMANLARDTADELSSSCGFTRKYLTYDMNKFIRRFNHFNQLVLDEKGERIDDEFQVMTTNGSLILSLVPPAAVEYLF